MPKHSIKNRLLKLPLPQKIVGGGALIALVSSFLPWYQDIDAFNTGDRFLGITGPLYLVGYIIIGLSIFSLILTGFYLLNKKLPHLPMKESIVYILSGAISLFLMIIANSVYFHPKFGVNIMSKEYQIGMILAFIGSAAITIGGVLQYKETGTSRFIKEFQEEAQSKEEELDPVLELNNFQKEQQIEHKKQDELIEETIIHTQQRKAEERTPLHSRPATGVREYKAKPGAEGDTTAGETVVRSEPYPDVAQIRREKEAEQQDKDKVNPNSVIRMDL